MTKDDEAQPKQTRRRRSTYAKRVEFRLTEAQLDLAEEARKASSAAAGRNVTLSNIVRAALMDGCKTIVRAVSSAPAIGGADRERVAEALDGFAEELRLLRADVNGMKNNVNQVAKKANAAGSPTPEQFAELRAHAAALVAVDQRLGALGKTAWSIAAGTEPDDD